MTAKRKIYRGKKSSRTDSAVKAVPSNNAANPDASDLSKQIAEVRATSYKIAKDMQGKERPVNRLEKKQIKALEARMEKLFKIVSPNSASIGCSNTVGLAQAYYYLSFVYFSYDHEVNSCTRELFLSQASELLTIYDLKPDVFMTTMRVYEALGSVFVRFHNYVETVEVLKELLALYEVFMSKNDVRAIPDTMWLLEEEEEKLDIPARLRAIYKKILQNLIAACNGTEELKVSCRLDVLKYGHTLVRLQLQSSLLKENEKHQVIATLLDLALNFLFFERFVEFRDHIALAHILLCITKVNERHTLRCTTCQYLIAQVNLGWAQYGRNILQLSSRRLLFSHSNRENCETGGAKPASSTPKSNGKSSPMLVFDEMREILNDASLISDKFCIDYKSAKKTFEGVLRCLYQVACYYTREQNSETYMTIMMHFFRVYDNFMYYETECDARMVLYLRQNEYLDHLNKFISKANNLYKWICIQKVIVAHKTLETLRDHQDQMYNEHIELPHYWKSRDDLIKGYAKHSLDWFQQYLHTK